MSCVCARVCVRVCAVLMPSVCIPVLVCVAQREGVWKLREASRLMFPPAFTAWWRERSAITRALEERLSLPSAAKIQAIVFSRVTPLENNMNTWICSCSTCYCQQLCSHEVLDLSDKMKGIKINYAKKRVTFVDIAVTSRKRPEGKYMF